MHEILRDFLVSTVAIAAIFGIIYVVLMTRHRERMSLLNRGLTPKDFYNRNGIISATLRYGLLLIGISMGILLGNFASDHLNVPRQGAFFAMILLFGGISLVISYLIERKKNKD